MAVDVVSILSWLYALSYGQGHSPILYNITSATVPSKHEVEWFEADVFSCPVVSGQAGRPGWSVLVVIEGTHHPPTRAGSRNVA